MATMHDIPALPLFEEAKSVRELLLDALDTEETTRNLCDEATNYLYRGVSGSRACDSNDTVFSEGIVTDFFRYQVNDELHLHCDDKVRDYVAEPMLTRTAFVTRELTQIKEGCESVYGALEYGLFTSHNLGGRTTSLKISATTNIDVAIAFAHGVTYVTQEEEDGTGRVYILNPVREARIVYPTRFDDYEKEVCIPAIVLGSEVLGVIDMATGSVIPNPHTSEGNKACIKVMELLSSVGMAGRLEIHRAGPIRL